MKSLLQNKITRVNLILTLIGLILGLWVYPDAPDEIAIHWGFDGQANGYGPKLFLLLFPLLILIADVVLLFARHIDPKKENYKKFSSSFDLIRLMLALLLFFCTIMTGMNAIDPGSVDIGPFVTLLLGIFFCVIGNVMPRFRPNYFAGLRTPWTIADEYVWQKTHRFGGRLWFGGGLVIGCSALLEGELAFLVVLITTLTIAILPLAYSYLLYRKRHR